MEGLDDTGVLAEGLTHAAQMQTLPLSPGGTEARSSAEKEVRMHQQDDKAAEPDTRAQLFAPPQSGQWDAEAAAMLTARMLY